VGVGVLCWRSLSSAPNKGVAHGRSKFIIVFVIFRIVPHVLAPSQLLASNAALGP
jgi:hypothetical protein